VRRHVDFLAVLYLVWGGLFALVGVAGFALAAGAWAIAGHTGPIRPGSDLAAGLTAITLALLAALALLWGALHLAVGSWLRRYRSAARLAAIALGVMNLVLLPFGTVLGAYAFWVLLTDEGRRMFEPHAAPGPPFPPGSTAHT